MHSGRTDFAGWVKTLEAMEADLERAGANPAEVRGEDMPRHDGGDTTGMPWTAPAGLGTIPPELADRARRLLDTQHMAIRRLEKTRNETGRHLGAVHTVQSAQPGGRPVYLDVTG